MIDRLPPLPLPLKAAYPLFIGLTTIPLSTVFVILGSSVISDDWFGPGSQFIVPGLMKISVLTLFGAAGAVAVARHAEKVRCTRPVTAARTVRVLNSITIAWGMFWLASAAALICVLTVSNR
jgi:hypothetical protein